MVLVFGKVLHLASVWFVLDKIYHVQYIAVNCVCYDF